MRYLSLKINIKFLILFSFVSLQTYSQVGIGTTAPDESSILDIQSTNKGVLFPRIDLGATNIPNPAKGLVVWNTDLLNGELNTGLFFWNGSAWLSLVSNEKLNTEINNIETAAGGSGWADGGNNATTGDFIGTTNYVPLEFRVNDQQVGYFDPVGGMALGSEANANQNKSIAIGDHADSSTSNEAIAVGSQSDASGYRSTAIGIDSESSYNNSIAIGTNANASGENSIAIGDNTSASALNATALGHNAIATQANTVILGDVNQTNVGIGTSTPSEKLEVNGSIKITDGTQGAGKVLTSDANGKASWVAPPDVKYFAEIRKSSTTNLDQYNYIPFGTTDFQHGITAGSNNFQIQNQPGIYRVSFKLMIQKTGGNSQNIKFFLAKGYSSTNLVAGSEVYANVSNGEIITISGEKLVQLNAWESIGIFSDTSSSNVQVLASGSSFNIEMISQ